MINVTKTYLPPFEEYTKQLKRAWNNNWITNHGELVQELELKLKEYLGVKHLLYCANGTVVLQLALRVYNISKEVITTPFSYVATTNAILWERCTPIFVDIESNTFCIDVDKIEAAITDNTEAILATHVYGFPCHIEKIQALAEKYKLKVIYDAAHAFGAKYNNRSLLSYGDITTCSFHATKLFHTVEGGCIITDDDEIADQLSLFRSFGHIGDDYFSGGINAKNSEFHAAMGLANLPHLETIIARRKQIFTRYIENLRSIGEIQLPGDGEQSMIYNYAYFPIVFETEEQLLATMQALRKEGVNSRRYFYPSLNTLSHVNTYQPCEVSEQISKRVLCIPFYPQLTDEDIDGIVSTIKISFR